MKQLENDSMAENQGLCLKNFRVGKSRVDQMV